MAHPLQKQAKAMGDSTRSKIFAHLADAGREVGVAELTAAFGINHTAVRQHLAQLVAAELVIESRAPSNGRGRPKLQYTVNPGADSRWGAVGPYERLSGWLAEVISTGNTPFDVGQTIGARRVQELESGSNEPPTEVSGDSALAVLVGQMTINGFEPTQRDEGTRVEITLATCPFESAARIEPNVICELHRGLAVGIAQEVGGLVVDDLIREDPQQADCRLICHRS